MGSPRVHGVSCAPIGEGGLLVFFPNRISSRINARVHALRRALLTVAPAGVIDLVPAYASLLVTFDPDRNSHSALAELMHGVLPTQVDGTGDMLQMGQTHVVPVRYDGEDGPDLIETAKLNNVTPEQLVELHCSRTYRAYFLGFEPGFAYLGKLPGGLKAPRLATPRTKVTAGSVGLAGAQTAVYPLQSPGGWRIIGRTSLTLWDPYAREPSRINPGDSVRFVPGDVEPAVARNHARSHVPLNPVFEVLAAQGLTTIQDLGRPGYAHLGVTTGGVFDIPAAMRANALAGNAADTALLELTWSGPELRARSNVTIALDGAGLECRVDGSLLPARMSWLVRRGSVISFSRPGGANCGVRAYLAVAGGLDVPWALGSRSTSLQAHFGGQEGRALQAGDILGIAKPSEMTGLLAGKYWPGKMAEGPEGEVELRFIPYRGRGEALAEARSQLIRNGYRLTEQADRMGYRFAPQDGAPLPVRRGELLSFGVVRGAIQLPPGGYPLVLNVDHQTTGGYPVLGVVIRADWPLLAQLAPGTTVRFRPVTLEEASRARRAADHHLDQGLRGLRTAG